MARFLAEEPVDGPFDGPFAAYGGVLRLQGDQRLNYPSQRQRDTPRRILLEMPRHIPTPTAPPSTNPAGRPAQPGLSEREREYRVLICKFLAAKFRDYGVAAPGHKFRSHAGSSKSTGQTSGSTSLTGANLHDSRKRGSQDAPESPDGPSETAGTETRRKKSRGAAEPPQQYACPCYRHDPDNLDFLHGGRFAKCRTKGIETGKLKYVTKPPSPIPPREDGKLTGS